MSAKRKKNSTRPPGFISQRMIHEAEEQAERRRELKERYQVADPPRLQPWAALTGAEVVGNVLRMQRMMGRL